MVTRSRTSRSSRGRQLRLFAREWRNFKKVSAVVVADALKIERESYLRLEREPWRINLEELEIIAEAIGVKSTQLRFLPPQEGEEGPISADELLEGAPENVRQMAIAAIRGMVGK